MTLLRERPEIREVPKLERPRRPWFGWIVSLLVLVIAGGIWLIARDGEPGFDGSFERNELARFERTGATALEADPTLDGFDLAELQRFERIPPLVPAPRLEVDGFGRAESARFARIGVVGEFQDGFDDAEFMRFIRLEP